MIIFIPLIEYIPNFYRFLNGIILNAGVQDAQGTSTLEVTEAGEYKCRAVSKAGKTFSTTAVVTFIC